MSFTSYSKGRSSSVGTPLRIPSTTWSWELRNEIYKPYWTQLEDFVEKERKWKNVLPEEKWMWESLSATAPSSVKVVLPSLEPSIHPYQSCGLAYSSIRGSYHCTKEARQIHRVLKRDMGIDNKDYGDLAYLAAQGVLLLPSRLTVEQGKKGSHADQGWEMLFCEVLKVLDRSPRRISFIFPGELQQYADVIENPNHQVQKVPDVLSEQFLFSRCFSEANKFIQASGRVPINWKVV